MLETLAKIVAEGLREDIGPGDVTTETLLAGPVQAAARFVAREEGVCAGLLCVREVYRQLEPRIEVTDEVSEGEQIGPGQSLIRVRGAAAPILSGERLSLNLLSRLCGIATLTRRYVDAVEGTGAAIYDTRKTTPGLRELEKHAVHVGGGANHRSGLHDQMLIKDNHLAALRANDTDEVTHVEEVLRRARAAYDGVIEIEIDHLDQVAGAVDADIILLDNFSISHMEEAVRFVNDRFATSDRRPMIEASGGVTLDRVRAIAGTGVDRISVGALTHTAASLDIGLDFDNG